MPWPWPWPLAVNVNRGRHYIGSSSRLNHDSSELPRRQPAASESLRVSLTNLNSVTRNGDAAPAAVHRVCAGLPVRERGFPQARRAASRDSESASRILHDMLNRVIELDFPFQLECDSPAGRAVTVGLWTPLSFRFSCDDSSSRCSIIKSDNSHIPSPMAFPRRG